MCTQMFSLVSQLAITECKRSRTFLSADLSRKATAVNIPSWCDWKQKVGKEKYRTEVVYDSLLSRPKTKGAERNILTVIRLSVILT